MPETVARFGITEQNVEDFVSERDYYYIYPLNGKYIIWLSDKITVHEIFKPFDAWMPECYYQIGKRDGETFLIQLRHLDKVKYGHDILSMLRFIRDKEILELADTKGGRSVLVGWDGIQYFYAPAYAPKKRTKITEETMVNRICEYAGVSVLREYLKPAEGFCSASGQPYLLNITIFNEMGDNPEIGRAMLEMDEPLEKEQVMDVSADGGKAEFLVSHDLAKVFPERMNYSAENQEGTSGTNVNDDNLNDREADSGAGRGTENPADTGRETALYDPRYYDVYLRMLSSVDRRDGMFSEALTVRGGKRVQITENPVSGVKILGEVPKWSKLVDMIDRLCRFVPELELFGAVLVITDNGPKIWSFQNMPDYPILEPFEPEITCYLKRKIREKKENYENPTARRERGHHKAKLKIRKIFAGTFYPKGLKPYLSITWIKDVLFDLFRDRSVPLSESDHVRFAPRVPEDSAALAVTAVPIGCEIAGTLAKPMQPASSAEQILAFFIIDSPYTMISFGYSKF